MTKLCGMILAMSLLALPVAHAQTVDTKADVQKLAGQWMNTYNSQDAAGVAKMYGPDAIESGPGWTATSRAAIEEATKKDMAAGLFKFTSIVVDQSQRTGDLVYSAGTWAADMKGPDGKDMPITGHWLIVGQYNNGNYPILIHNFNMQMPPPSK
jgi:ketosteroid isomerase-like protein